MICVAECAIVGHGTCPHTSTAGELTELPMSKPVPVRVSVWPLARAVDETADRTGV